MRWLVRVELKEKQAMRERKRESAADWRERKPSNVAEHFPGSKEDVSEAERSEAAVKAATSSERAIALCEKEEAAATF